MSEIAERLGLRMRRMSWVAVLCCAGISAFATGCQKASPPQAEQPKPQVVTQTVQPQVAVPTGDDERSCRAFVQKFYDWYWNQSSGNADAEQQGDDKVPALKPAVLSPELIRLMKRDEARAKASGTYANLDFDPFLNSQDPDGKYNVVRVTVKGGVCRAKLSQRDIVAEARRSGPGWVFSNFYYPNYSEDGHKIKAPDDDPDDLIHILRLPCCD
jgi:hypothetical protein